MAPKLTWKHGLVDAFPIPDRLPPKPEPVVEKATGTNTSTGQFNLKRLPRELRDRVISFVLSADADQRTAILAANKQCNVEASRVLYSIRPVRLFFLQEFKHIPTLMELAPHQRKLVTTLDITLGPSWTDPPKSMQVSKALNRACKKMDRLRRLKIFVECDPSTPMFKNFRKSQTFYTDFCGDLIDNLLKAMPQVAVVRIDGRQAVEKDGPLVSRLKQEIQSRRRSIEWGPGLLSRKEDAMEFLPP